MRRLLESIPCPALLVIAIFLGIAPITPQPHLVEKLRMLFLGTLAKPIDIFDLLFHAAPLVLLALKLTLGRNPGQD